MENIAGSQNIVESNEVQSVIRNTSVQPPRPSSSKSKRPRCQNAVISETLTMMKTATDVLRARQTENPASTEVAAFTNFIASKMIQYPSNVRKMLEYEIIDVFKRADLQNYSNTFSQASSSTSTSFPHLSTSLPHSNIHSFSPPQEIPINTYPPQAPINHLTSPSSVSSISSCSNFVHNSPNTYQAQQHELTRTVCIPSPSPNSQSSQTGSQSSDRYSPHNSVPSRPPSSPFEFSQEFPSFP